MQPGELVFRREEVNASTDPAFDLSFRYDGSSWDAKYIWQLNPES